MKILLANPPFRVKENNRIEKYFVRAGSRWPYSETKDVSDESIYRPFPFSLAYSARILKNTGHDVFAVDGVALQYTQEEFEKHVFSREYDFAAVEIAPFSIKNDIEFAKALRKKGTVVIAVGPFVSLLLAAISNNLSFSWAINGEYETALSEFVNNSGKKHIKGVYKLEQEFKVENLECADLIDKLDLLPFPLREIFPSNEKAGMNYYWDVFCQYKPAVQMHASRGCPYGCYFCLWNQVMNKNGKYRVFSAQRVVDEVEDVIKKYNAKEIYFDDDDFTIDKKHTLDICDEMIKRKINIKWSCMADAINIDESIIAKMAKSGCIGIKFGVESVNSDVLKQINKPVKLNKVIELVKWCIKYGIRSHATFSFGLLGETKESMNETLEFAKKLDIDSVQFSIATPYPGTVFYEKLKKDNMIEDFDWMNYDGSSKCVVNYPNLTSREIESFFNSAFKKWLRHKLKNPFWVMRQVKIFLNTMFSNDLKYTLNFSKKLINKLRG